MAKKQQMLTHSFGKRSLSVILALLMVLSTFAVMLTATSITADAAISYWFVSGDFNSWTQSANSTNQINGSSGSVTIPMTRSSIEFKMVAYESGNKWCGNSSGTLTVGTESELQWNSGSNMRVALPANTVSVTFTLSTRNYSNYVKVTANTKEPNPDPPVIGDTRFSAKVNASNPANLRDNIFWADATYYDYLSDKEMASGWLYPDHIGTSNFNGNIDEWYPFYTFNRNVVKSVADSNSLWAKPLYFGNFCNTYGAYDTSHHPGVTNGFNDATNSYNVTRFNYAANNSNGVYDMYTSVQGLMGSSLKNGKLQTPDGTIAPYFDEATLGSNARVVKSAFPFRKTDMGGYMRYEFDSTDAKDNVYFTWETSGGRSYPKYVNYGSGTTYGVKDGLKDFLNTTSGYGIFPFNNASSNYKGTKTYTNENLDYGFGIRMDMKFRVPANQNVQFDFSGDDDLWMYITDESGNSQLVLDMGGSHKQSEGIVNFNTGTATVYKVDDPSASNKDIWIQEESNWGNVVIWAWNNSGNGEWYYGDSYSNLYRFRDDLIGSNGNPLSSKTSFQFMKDTSRTGQSPNLSISERAGKCSYTNNSSYYNTNNAAGGHSVTRNNYFNFDVNKTYTMTIFYMERGLIESNCKMGFTLTPLGNNFIVTERIDTANVNEGIRDIVKQVSSFGFSYTGTSKDGSAINGTFSLGDGGSMEIPDSIIGINSNVSVQQSTPSDSYLIYDTTWDYWDNVNNKKFENGVGTTGNNSTTATGSQTMIDSETGDEYDYAELQVNYVNTPQVTDLVLTKKVVDSEGNDISKDFSDETFDATISLQFSSDTSYNTYTLMTNKGYAIGGKVTLKAGETIIIPDVPVGTHIRVKEDEYSNYTTTYAPAEEIVLGTNNSVTINNSPLDATGTIKARKYITMPSGDKGLYENGKLFTFKVEGMGSVQYEPGKKSESTADMSSKELSLTDSNGEVVFKNSGEDNDNFLKFTKVGTYFVKVYETKIANVGTYSSDISLDKTVYLARFDVANVDGKLTVSEAAYYQYNGGNIDLTSGVTDVAEFNNPARPASVTINKTDGANSKLGDVWFNIYKVDGDKGEIKEENAIGEAKKTDANGICTFSNIDIYKQNASGKYGAEPEYQWYALQETRAKDGYAKSTVIRYFTFPMEDSATGEPKYDITFDYVNGAIKNPDTAGPGMIALKIAGLSIILFAAALLAYYVLRNKKRTYKPAHAGK